MNKNNTIVLHDKLNTCDKGTLKSSSFHKPMHNRVIVHDELGNVLSDGTNEVLLQGSYFTLAKMFGLDIPFGFQTLNENLGVNDTETSTAFSGPRREEVVMLFSTGIDGCSEIYGDIQTVKIYKNGSNNLIPFRRVPVSKDLTLDEQSKYGIKKEVNGFFEYYTKVFESNPVFKSIFSDTGEDLSSDICNQNIPPERVEKIENYVLLKLKISKTELREYFAQVGEGLEKSRVNTISLCIGYTEYDENNKRMVKGIVPITMYNFNNEPLDNDAKELYIDYMVYV